MFSHARKAGLLHTRAVREGKHHHPEYPILISSPSFNFWTQHHMAWNILPWAAVPTVGQILPTFVYLLTEAVWEKVFDPVPALSALFWSQNPNSNVEATVKKFFFYIFSSYWLKWNVEAYKLWFNGLILCCGFQAWFLVLPCLAFSLHTCEGETDKLRL